jgi:IS4 transposase
VSQVYRRRFGIETRYRQLHEARIKTSPRDPRLRLLCVGIALRLPHVWVRGHWHCLSTPRRGRRQLNLHYLRFATLLIWFVHWAEQTFGIHDSVVVRRLL